MVPEDLRRFVQSGDPPAVIAFGSVASPDLHRILAETVCGIRQAGKRAVIVTGWGKHKQESDSDVLVVPSAPYAWLFKHAAVVIHAGGSGTVAEISRAGVPSIPVPFAAEQRFWSQRLWKLGTAVRPIRPQTLNRQSVLSALQEIAAEPRMRERAARLADKIARETGAQAAAEFLSSRVLTKAREIVDEVAEVADR
jgi:UDP:flavonoid glycosyltransferase YjiC (YdhE family)